MSLCLADPVQLYVKGWTRRGTWLVLKSIRPDLGGMTEVWEIGAPRGPRRVASITGLLGMTVRLDRARDRLFGTCTTGGVSAICQVSLGDGAVKTVVANAVEGVTFAGYSMTPDGWLIYARKDTNHDVWIFELADR